MGLQYMYICTHILVDAPTIKLCGGNHIEKLRRQLANVTEEIHIILEIVLHMNGSLCELLERQVEIGIVHQATSQGVQTQVFAWRDGGGVTAALGAKR